jgi:hypothetical protein
MAQIYEEVIIIKLSKLVKTDGAGTVIANEDFVTALTSVAEELVGTGVVVEVEKA